MKSGVLLSAFCILVAAQARPADLLIVDVTLISPERAAPLQDADVLIQDGLITRIGTELVAPGAQRIDGRGRFLIPGLIDSHVHVDHVVGLDDDIVAARPALLDEYRAQLPRSYLAFGFTTLVDLDFEGRSTQTWYDAQPLHPRLIHCGPGIRIPAGYGTRRITKDAKLTRIPNLVHEPAQSGQWPLMLDPKDYTPERAVERAAAMGATCVKVFVESGFGGTFDWPVPRPETLEAIRAATSARGMKMVVHANAVDAWQAALGAHADIIAHGLWQWPGNKEDATVPEAARAVIAAAAHSGVRVQPTARVIHGERSLLDAEILGDPRFAMAMPPGVVDYLHSEAAVRARTEMRNAYFEAAPNFPQLLSVAEQRVSATFELMNAAGVRIIFGSDTPSGEGFGNPPGFNGLLELRHWADAGVPLAAILRGATLDNATAFGLEKEIGSIEIGKRADLLLLSNDPLGSIEAYESIETVFVDGTPVPRRELAAKR